MSHQSCKLMCIIKGYTYLIEKQIISLKEDELNQAIQYLQNKYDIILGEDSDYKKPDNYKIQVCKKSHPIQNETNNICVEEIKTYMGLENNLKTDLDL